MGCVKRQQILARRGLAWRGAARRNRAWRKVAQRLRSLVVCASRLLLWCVATVNPTVSAAFEMAPPASPSAQQSAQQTGGGDPATTDEGDDAANDSTHDEAGDGADDEADDAGPPLELVVTGTRREEASEQSAVRTQTIGAAAIERRQARTLAEALRYTSGVRVETNCQNCGFTQLRLNGLGGHYTQVLIDGMPVFSTLAGVYGLEQMPAEMISRIEVVKGGASALYGPGAVAGVVNVVTKRPENSYGKALLSTEFINLTDPAILARVGVDGAVVSDDRRFGLALSGAIARRGEGDYNGDGFSDVTRLRQYAVHAQGTAELFSQAELKLAFHAIHEYRRGGDRLDLPPHEAIIAEELGTDRVQGTLEFRHVASEHFDYRISYAFAHTRRDSYYGGTGADPDDAARAIALRAYGTTQNPLHYADAHGNFFFRALGEMIVTAGAQVQADIIEDRYLGYQREIDANYMVIAGYVQHEWIFASWGRSLIGVRVDKHSALREPIASPRIALRFAPLTWLRLRTALSTGFRAPQAFDEDLHIQLVGGTLPRLIVNDAGLNPERSYSAAQQVEAVFDLASDWTSTVSINGYVTLLTGAFALVTADVSATPEVEVTRANGPDVRVAGAEVEWRVAYRERVELSVSATGEDARASSAVGDFDEPRLMRTPQGYGTAEIVVRPLAALELQSGLVVQGPMLVPRYGADGEPFALTRSPWFFDWSIAASYEFAITNAGRLKVFTALRNVLNQFQPDLPRGPSRDAGYVYGPLQPRSVLLGISGAM